MSFDAYAKKWDTETRIERAGVIAKEIIQELDKDKYESAMEFGCGTGLISFNLTEQFSHITMVDSSKGMIDILNEKIKDYGSDKLMSHFIDIEEGGDIEGQFDVIYSSLVLHHIKDIKSISAKFFKLLKSKGEICIVDLNEEDGSFHKKESNFNGHNGFNQYKLRELFESVGFESVTSKTFYKGEKHVNDRVVNYSLFMLKAKKVVR